MLKWRGHVAFSHRAADSTQLLRYIDDILDASAISSSLVQALATTFSRVTLPQGLCLRYLAFCVSADIGKLRNLEYSRK